MRIAPRRVARPGLCLCLLVAGLAGCATHRYVSDAPGNLTVRAEIESSLFRKSGAHLDILGYREGQACGGDYLGTLELDEQPVQAGLPAGRKIVLRFVLGLRGKGRGAFGYERPFTTVHWVGILTPRPGAQYVARVRYDGDMYEVHLQEVNSRGDVVREFERQQTGCAVELAGYDEASKRLS